MNQKKIAFLIILVMIASIMTVAQSA